MTASASSNTPPTRAVIMAAGKGTRMGGDLPKVLYPIADEPMVRWVVRACREAGVEQCILVVGYRSDLVREALADESDVTFVEQTQQLGTAHAVQQALPKLEGFDGPVFVLAGDGPLIRGETLATVLAAHREADAAATLATAVIADPTGYGRVLREADGSFAAIVEHKDATDAQRQVREINPSYYCFDAAALRWGLSKVSNDNSQGEYYITDVPGLLKREQRTVVVIDAVPEADVLSINTPEQLAEVDRIFRERISQTTRSGASA